MPKEKVNILQNCINTFEEFKVEGKPSTIDYRVYFTWNIVRALVLTPNGVFNKPLPDYFRAYYAVCGLLSEFMDKLEDKHFDWFDKLIDSKICVQNKVIKIWVNMKLKNKDRKLYTNNLVHRL